LKWYVYRLIDPRNGETFYVGKGQGDRVFQHAIGALGKTNAEEAADLKAQRIKEIHTTGLAVSHVIHRHNIESSEVALQIEAALIDAYAGLTNRVGGHGSGDYGVRHVEEIVSEYTVDQFVTKEPLILISIGRSYEDEERNVYQAAQAAWVIDGEKAQREKQLVLAHRRGLVVGAWRPDGWFPATKERFPWLENDIPGRWGFEGPDAEEEVRGFYVGKRVPDKYRAKGAANPIRYGTP